jgi:hypothetical protein
LFGKSSKSARLKLNKYERKICGEKKLTKKSGNRADCLAILRPKKIGKKKFEKKNLAATAIDVAKKNMLLAIRLSVFF